MEFKSNLKGQIEIKGIRSYAYHGLHQFEKKTGAWFETDVILYLRWYKVPVSIEETLDYEMVYTVVKDEMHQSRDLIETLCASILFRLQELFGNQCDAIDVSVTKPQVPLPNTASTSCKMRWEPGVSQ